MTDVCPCDLVGVIVRMRRVDLEPVLDRVPRVLPVRPMSPSVGVVQAFEDLDGRDARQSERLE